MAAPNPPDRLVEIERTAERLRYRLELAADDPMFTGHFPGHPILPGVGQLFLVTQAIERSLGRPITWTGMPRVSFRQRIAPGSPCLVDVDLPEGESVLRFTIRSEADGKPIADGQLATSTDLRAGLEGAVHG